MHLSSVSNVFVELYICRFEVQDDQTALVLKTVYPAKGIHGNSGTSKQLVPEDLTQGMHMQTSLYRNCSIKILNKQVQKNKQLKFPFFHKKYSIKNTYRKFLIHREIYNMSFVEVLVWLSYVEVFKEKKLPSRHLYI